MDTEFLLHQLGERLTRRRIDLGLTQTELSQRAGVGKRTVERLEAGHSTQMSNFVRILRALDLLDEMLAIVPETGPSPMDLLKLKGKERKRAYSGRNATARTAWTWNDNA